MTTISRQRGVVGGDHPTMKTSLVGSTRHSESATHAGHPAGSFLTHEAPQASAQARPAPIGEHPALA